MTEGRRRDDLLVRRREVELDPGATRAELRTIPALRAVQPVLRHLLGTFCVNTSEKIFSITYDDGPDPVNTPAILDTLRSWDVKVTFFVLAAAAERHPQLIRRIRDEGHELALHGLDHRRLTSMSHRQAVRSVLESRERLEAVAGCSVTLFRPPYGAFSLRQARSFWSMGLDVVIWSGAATDWVDAEEETVVGRALDAVHPGGFLLLHETRADPETLAPGEELPTFDRAKVLDRLIEETRAVGYESAPVGTLLDRFQRVRSIARDRMT